MRILIVFRDRNSKFMTKIKKQVSVLIKNSKIESAWKNKLSQEQFNDKDLIIAVGGDGTFLSASHYLSNQSIIGVNSNPKRSAGFLTSTNLKNLDKKLKQISKGDYKIRKYSRINAKIFHKNKCVLTEKALNEIYVGNARPQHVSIYHLNIRNKRELQKSSGILISTGTGSTAWYKSMGGKSFSKLSKKLRFIVREPLNVKTHKTKIIKGQVSAKDKLILESKINHCILSIDSIREYKIKKGNSIEISLGEPLKVII